MSAITSHHSTFKHVFAEVSEAMGVRSDDDSGRSNESRTEYRAWPATVAAGAEPTVAQPNVTQPARTEAAVAESIMDRSAWAQPVAAEPEQPAEPEIRPYTGRSAEPGRAASAVPVVVSVGVLFAMAVGVAFAGQAVLNALMAFFGS